MEAFKNSAYDFLVRDVYNSVRINGSGNDCKLFLELFRNGEIFDRILTDKEYNDDSKKGFCPFLLAEPLFLDECVMEGKQ